MPLWPPSTSSKCSRSSGRPAASSASRRASRAEVEEVLVAAARVEPHAAPGLHRLRRARSTSRTGSCSSHRSNLRQHAPLVVERQRPVAERTRGRRQLDEQRVAARLEPVRTTPRTRRASRRTARAARARRPGTRARGHLEQRVGRVRGDGVEEIRPLHRVDERAVAARRLPLQPTQTVRRVLLVDERHDLVAQVRRELDRSTGRRRHPSSRRRGRRPPRVRARRSPPDTTARTDRR